MKRAALYICYYHVSEPLVYTQVIAYLRELAKRGIEIHLLTFERDSLSAETRRTIRNRLAEEGIEWHFLRYHQRPSLPATLYDIAVGTWTAMRICQQYNIRLIHARSHVPAAMALPLKRLLGCRLLFDVRGLMAEEYADAGHWTTGDLKFRLTKRMERVFFQAADALVMLTQRIKDELVASEPALQTRAADIQVIPCCVDVERFALAPEMRVAWRRERGWTDRRVLTYVGKLGSWYLADHMARFFAVVSRQDARFFFQVLSQSDPAPMRQALQVAGVSPEHYDIRFVPPQELPQMLASSDAGISFIRACYSKRASSPTKVGEYLAAGLPVVANAGIGDCDRTLQDHRLGVIVREYSDADYEGAAHELRVLLDDPATSHRCRQVAECELSLSQVGGPRYSALYERLLDSYAQGSSGQAADPNSQAIAPSYPGKNIAKVSCEESRRQCSPQENISNI